MNEHNSPKMTIVCPSYNHEKFVAEFIESVLTQTVSDWELIIVDDNSTDGTVTQIEKFSDPRIHLLRHSWNMGINAGLNDGVKSAKGEYIVFCASDDVLYPQHLETVSNILDSQKDVGAVACLLSAIDEKGVPSDYLQHWGKPEIHNRFLTLRKMFLDTNFMLSPGMTVRKSLLQTMTPLPISEVMIQDYALWVKIFFASDVVWSPEPLVYYRRMSDGLNISSRTEKTQIRYMMEEPQLLDVFLNASVDILARVFEEDLDRLGLALYSDTVPFILGRIALTSEHQSRRGWGYRTIVNFIKSTEGFRKVHELYGFDYKMLLELVPEPSVKKPRSKRIRRGSEKFFYKLFRHFEKRNLKAGYV